MNINQTKNSFPRKNKKTTIILSSVIALLIIIGGAFFYGKSLLSRLTKAAKRQSILIFRAVLPFRQSLKFLRISMSSKAKKHFSCM